MASQSRHDLKSWMLKTIAAGFAALPLVLLVTAALCVLAGTARANILVSRYDNDTLEIWDDAGQNIVKVINVGGGGTEGIACIKLMNNQIYVANNTGTIKIYDLNTGNPVSTFDFPSGTSIAAIALNVTGTRLYAADYGRPSGIIYVVDLPNPNGGPCKASTGNCAISTPTAHDVAIGPDGDLYATEFDNDTGVWAYKQTPGIPGLMLDTVKYPPNGIFIPVSLAPRPGGMVFDGAGNLWMTNTDGPKEGIYEFAGPNSLNPIPGTLLNSAPQSGDFPLGLDVSPLNPASPPVDSCKGCIVGAELRGNRIVQIDPAHCTGGTCTVNTFFLIGTPQAPGEPKYVHFTENCCDVGYVEICKLTCVYNQVTGYFNFTASNSGVTVGPLSIPVNACSAPIQIPNGTVNIKETQRLGVVLNNIVAYDYDYFGNQINALLSENLPFTNANVNVVSGDISTETVVGFTNCASGPGELKICKVAGSNDLVGDSFTFTAKGFGAPIRYTVPAGPPPGGYCVVAGSYQAGTPVLVTEPAGQNNSMVSNIAVAPPDRQGAKTGNSVIAVVDSGTTEVTFTDVDTPRGCSGPNLLINGSFETGDFTGWTVNNREGGLGVASGPIHNSPGAEDGQFYAQVSGGFQVSISQTLMTSPGQTYHVCFWLNAVGDPGSFFQGYWGTNQFLNLNPPNTGGVWQQYVEGAFTGTGGDTLQFVFQDQTGVLGLDNVVVSSP